MAQAASIQQAPVIGDIQPVEHNDRHEPSQHNQQTTSGAQWWHGLVAGPLSGIAARLVVAPADTVKARLQVQGALPGGAVYRGGTLSAAKQMLASEGLLGFYKGFGAVLWGVVPANVAYFGGYEAGKAFVPQMAPGLSPVAHDMAVGMVAQLLAGLVYTPIDIVKERLQVQAIMGGAYTLHSARSAFASLLSSGQPLRGYWVTNSVWLPWNALYIAAYEHSKSAAAEGLGIGSPASLPAWAVAGCSAASAAAAALVTHPADVVKTRLQVLTAAPGGAGLSAVGIAQHMWATEGPRAFFHGLAARVANIAPGCALSWALYETCKRWLGKAGSAKDLQQHA